MITYREQLTENFKGWDAGLESLALMFQLLPKVRKTSDGLYSRSGMLRAGLTPSKANHLMSRAFPKLVELGMAERVVITANNDVGRAQAFAYSVCHERYNQILRLYFALGGVGFERPSLPVARLLLLEGWLNISGSYKLGVSMHDFNNVRQRAGGKQVYRDSLTAVARMLEPHFVLAGETFYADPVMVKAMMALHARLNEFVGQPYRIHVPRTLSAVAKEHDFGESVVQQAFLQQHGNVSKQVH